ncbi:MAG: adaptor protein MecA [Eubacterium sp.]|nr:adaptor protein MecA [Eubacterium sp.]
MKIEKISENQIRCTLTSADLSSRQMKLSELAYGSEKARRLFQDMMQEAEYEFGFTSDNSPLMIEAIPTSLDSIVLIITKVEDPEELDTRFARFTKSDETDTPAEPPSFIGADDILDLFHKIREAVGSKNKDTGNAAPAKKQESAKETAGSKKEASKETTPVNLVQSFRFSSLDDLIRAAQNLQTVYSGSNTVYIEEKPSKSYLLILHQSDCTPEVFNRVCNMLSEYGISENSTPVKEAWTAEHRQVLLADDALQKLARLG